MSQEPDKLEKITLRLYLGDIRTLSDFYPKTGYNRVIRALVRRHVRALKEKDSTESRISTVEIEDLT